MAKAMMGAVLTLAGSLVLVGLIFVANCTSHACERVMLGMGLALTAVVSAAAQIAVLVGIWLMWRAAKAR